MPASYGPPSSRTCLRPPQRNGVLPKGTPQCATCYRPRHCSRPSMESEVRVCVCIAACTPQPHPGAAYPLVGAYPSCQLACVAYLPARCAILVTSTMAWQDLLSQLRDLDFAWHECYICARAREPATSACKRLEDNGLHRAEAWPTCLGLLQHTDCGLEEGNVHRISFCRRQTPNSCRSLRTIS